MLSLIRRLDLIPNFDKKQNNINTLNMKRLILTLGFTAIMAGTAIADTATFDFTADDPYGWNSLTKDDSGYIQDASLPVKCKEGVVTITLNGRFRRMAQRALDGKTCLLLYRNATASMSCDAGYKMNSITFYSATGKIPDLKVTEGESELGEATPTGGSFNHTESGVSIDEITRTAMCNTAGPLVFTDEGGTQVITKIEIDYEATTKKEAGLKYAVKDFTAFMNTDNKFPVLENPNNLKVDFSSENEEVATIDPATGAITLVAPGQTKILAGTDGNSEFDWGEASYILTVKREGELSAVYNFGKFTIDDNKVGYMTNFPDIPYNGNSTTWWTTNPNEKDSYAAGTQFKPLTISCDGTSITFSWDGKGGHGNLRATTTSKVNNLQLGGGTALTIRPESETATLYDVVIAINNANNKWEDVTEKIETDEAGKLTYDKETTTVVWSPKEAGAKQAYIDAVEGAYITAITVNYKAGLGSAVEGIAVEESDAPAEYYNLQGIRVNPDNAAPGIYIVRKGSKVSKILRY